LAVAGVAVLSVAAITALRNAKKGPSRSALLSAELAVESARLEVGRATGVERDMAKKQLAIAKAGLAELRHGPELAAAKSARAEAAKVLEQSKRDLAALRKTVGVSVPYCEVVFVPSAPAGVARVASQGTGADQPSVPGTGGWASLASGELLLTTSVNGLDGDLIKVGATVSFRSNADVVDSRGVVSSVEPDVASGKTTITVKPDEPFDEADRGKSLRVEIEVESTSGEVLVVPVAAVSGTADGLAQVERLSGQATAMVRVRAGLSADGFVEVVPVDAGTLDVGDEVVVGR
jgi:hypothetical protein